MSATPTTVPRFGWHWSHGRDSRPVIKTRVLGSNEIHEVVGNVGTRVSLLDTIKIEPCRNGFHYCPDLLDSLRYGTGTFLSRVQGHGTLVQAGDKVAAQSREIIWWIDATELIAGWCDFLVVGASPAQLTMIRSRFVDYAAHAAWKRHPDGAQSQQWSSHFNKLLHTFSDILVAHMVDQAKATGAWRPDPPEETA